MSWIRTGTCNLCGECCGGGDGEQFGPPFRGHNHLNNTDPSDDPWFIQLIPSSWQDEALDDYGSANVATILVRWIWVEGVGLCTDLPPAGKPPYAKRCPFVQDEPTPPRPCLMYGNTDEIPWMPGTTYADLWDTY